MNGKIYRAGLLPYILEDGVAKFLFMKPSNPKYGGDMFQIAKGKIEIDETPEDAAIREASEELGLVPDNIQNLLFLGNFLGRTSIYMAEVSNKNRFVEPHFETSETAWMSLAEFLASGRKLHHSIVSTADSIVHLTCK